jgi:hypothetical protein
MRSLTKVIHLHSIEIHLNAINFSHHSAFLKKLHNAQAVARRCNVEATLQLKGKRSLVHT